MSSVILPSPYFPLGCDNCKSVCLRGTFPLKVQFNTCESSVRYSIFGAFSPQVEYVYMKVGVKRNAHSIEISLTDPMYAFSFLTTVIYLLPPGLFTTLISSAFLPLGTDKTHVASDVIYSFLSNDEYIYNRFGLVKSAFKCDPNRQQQQVCRLQTVALFV